MMNVSKCTTGFGGRDWDCFFMPGSWDWLLSLRLFLPGSWDWLLNLCSVYIPRILVDLLYGCHVQ